jgi:hypothetical protein
MQRTLMTILMIHVIALLAGMFILLDLSVEAIASIINSSDFAGEMGTLGGMLFEALITPATALTETNAYAPFAVLIITGFIAGLISKDGTRIMVAILSLILILFIGYVALNGIVPLETALMKEVALTMKTDLGVTFFVLFMSGIAGAAFTAETY